VQVYQVPLAASSLNNSDCFVLDNGLTLFQFNGEKSTAWEKRKAAAIVQGLKAARLGKVQNEYTIDGLRDKGNKLIDDFWKLLGGKPQSIKEEEEVKEVPDVELRMMSISDASGKMEIEEVSKGKLDKSALKSECAFLIDAGTMIFVWIGKDADGAEKKRSMEFATEYLAGQDRPPTVPICRVSEGKEPTEFWDAFAGKAVGGRHHDGKKWKA